MDSCIKRLRDLSSSQFGLLSLFKMRVLATGGLLLLLNCIKRESHCGALPQVQNKGPLIPQEPAPEYHTDNPIYAEPPTGCCTQIDSGRLPVPCYDDSPMCPETKVEGLLHPEPCCVSFAPGSSVPEPCDDSSPICPPDGKPAQPVPCCNIWVAGSSVPEKCDGDTPMCDIENG